MDGRLADLEAWPANGRTLTVTLVGAGNVAHVIAGELGARKNCNVRMLSRKADKIQHAVTHGITVNSNPIRKVGSKLANGEVVTDRVRVVGKVQRISSRAEDVVPGSDLIIMTNPSQSRPGTLAKIVPHISADRPVLLGALPGLGGFDWMCSRALALRPELRDVYVWSLKDIPFMSTRVVPGKSADNLGPKNRIYLGLAPGHEAALTACKAVIIEMFHIPLSVIPHFLAITLTPGNPIMHPAIYYGMFGPRSQWDRRPLPDKPLFYEGISEISAYFLQRLDDEVQDIKHAFERQGGIDLEVVWPLRRNQKMIYNEDIGDNRTLMTTLRTNNAYRTIRTPLIPVEGGFMPTTEHRFFHEDIPFGLVILKGLAKIAEVDTPYMDEILTWAQDWMGKSYLTKDGELNGPDCLDAGHPQSYGITTVSQIVHGMKATASKL